MPNVELKRLVGQMCDTRTGKLRSVGWNMDQLFLDNKQIATINRVPGAPVGLMQGVMLTPAELNAVVAAVAKQRGGVKPAHVRGPIEVGYELLDDEDETDVDEVDEVDDE